MDSEAKINALRDHILEKCREQGITIEEFKAVIQTLTCAVDKRRSELTDSVLIPKDKPLSDYYHIF